MKTMKNILALMSAFAILVTPLMVEGQTPANMGKPNIVLISMDNFGWGELGVYGGGILRGAATPRIDKLAGEGMRLLNFNTEASCTPSRAALMSGRYAVRTGNATVPLDNPLYGLVQWEYTMAEMFSDAGYGTAMFGKWHLGHTAGRFPTDQGFDEWYGIPNSSDESTWPDNDRYRPDSDKFAHPEHIMEGRKGTPSKEVRLYNTKERTLIDKDLTDKSIDYMQRQTQAKKPFFLYIPYTQPHMPALPHPDFKGKTKNGHMADVLAQIDAYTGRLIDEVDRLGIRDNTIFIFTADNTAEFSVPHHGFTGPWRGTYVTGLEGGIRVPFIIRWPGKVPAGAVNNEIVREFDLFSTFARIVGGKVPTDRVIDSVDQTDFFLGKQERSNREAFVVYVGADIYGVKWRNWKMMFKETDRGGGILKENSLPLFYDLNSDPKEEHPMDRWYENAWVRWPAAKVLSDHLATVAKEPHIRAGQTDPYVRKK
jgi:arylsulfatase